ncbi:uncharacterized protein V6R79_016011 [Siganus canaliculatus]
MGTKRPSCTLFDPSSNINTSDRKLQPGGKISRDPSPRPAMTAQSGRERDTVREEDWRREREMEKMRDKARYKDMDPRDKYYDRDRGPASRTREGERQWRDREKELDFDRNKNGRPLSSVEREAEREGERGKKKGDTFPRLRKRSADRGERRHRDRPRGGELDDWERERERTWHRERERDDLRGRGREEGPSTGRRHVEDERPRQRDRYQEFDAGVQDRRRDASDTWDRREREKLRPDVGRRGTRTPSPYDRDRRVDSGRREQEKTQKREGRRDTRSDGDSDERELRREKVRDGEREEIHFRHCRSEGDNMETMEKRRDRDKHGYREEERQRHRDRNREREVDRSRRREVEKERYREHDRGTAREATRGEERWRESERDVRDDRRQDDRYREHKPRKNRDARGRDADPRWDESAGRGGRSGSETAPRVTPRAQSSGEWSTTESDRDVDEQRNPERTAERSQREQKRSERPERERGEMTGGAPEQRRMWLEPQRGTNSREGYVDRERQTREKESRVESQAEWGRAQEEAYERYLDQSSHRDRRGGINELREREAEGVSVDGEDVGEAWRDMNKARKGRPSDSDGRTEGSWLRSTGGDNVTDNTEESDREEQGGSDCWEGGSETCFTQDRHRMPSGEDGFVTVSSGGDEEDDREEEDEEDQFEDCQEFLESGVPSHGSSVAAFKGPDGDEEREEETDEKQPKYVFCVIGQTLPRSKARDKSPSQGDQLKEVEKNSSVLKGHHQDADDAIQHFLPEHYPTLSGDEHTINNSQPREERASSEGAAEVDIRYKVSPQGQNTDAGEKMRPKKEHPYAEIGPAKRDSQTERLLVEWREKNKEGVEKVWEAGRTPSDVDYPQVNIDQIQPFLDGINTGAMSPEEVEAIRIRLSGAWSISEEPKRHSQAPHLKWAKSVVREILGHSEENTFDEPSADIQGEPGVGQSEIAVRNDKQLEEVAQETGHMPELNLRADEVNSEPELEEEEPLEVEGLRDDEDDRSKSWGEVELGNVLEAVNRRKRNSKFFNAAQLYQQYSEAAQNFEILRQARSDVLSVSEETTSSPAPSPPPARRPLPPLPPVRHPHSLSHTPSITSAQSLPLPEPPKTEGRPSSPRLSISLTQSSTLWRELPAVRNSTELEELTEDQRRLQEVRFEVVTSEASYCRSLDIVVDHFVKSKQLGALLTTQDKNWLFSRLADVRAISHSFLAKLEERVETDVISFTVCDIIARHCQRFKMVYVPYLANQSYQDATYQRLMNENPQFRRIVEKLERSPVCQRLPLRSFLVLPFQRITRIKLLVQNIVKRTTPGTPEATQAIKSLKLLEKLIQESNDSITQMKSIESLVSLSARVDFECRTLPLISQSRRLVREGPITELMDFSLKDREKNIYLHLFNDYLLISLQKEGGRFSVVDHSPVSELRAENCRVKLHSLQKNLFRLHMSHKSLLLRTDTLSDKLRWISALSRPHPDVDFSAAQDFLQMQCIRAVVGQQPDELSLEKADIILVHQQSSDHWVEGTRLSDRHRGWIPESHLETISNARVRQRNLSDALKLTTATAAV